MSYDAWTRAMGGVGGQDEDAGHKSIEGLIGQYLGRALKWLTILSALWSYRVFEPFFVRGMGKNYYGRKQVMIAAFCLFVFPYWWVVVMPAALAVLHIIPGVNLVAIPLAHVFPDGLAFLGLKDNMKKVAVAYNGEREQSLLAPLNVDKNAPPSVAEVVRKNLAKEKEGKTINQKGVSTIKLILWIFPISLVEAMWHLLGIDLILYAIFCVGFIFVTKRHFYETRLVRNTGYEGKVTTPFIPWKTEGEWGRKEIPIATHWLMLLGGVLAIVLGFSLCGALLIVGGLSFFFFRSRLTAKREGELHSSIASGHSSKQTEEDRKALEAELKRQEEIARQEIAEKQRRKREKAEKAKQGVGGRPTMVQPKAASVGGVEIARAVYGRRRKRESEVLKHGLASMEASDDPEIRAIAEALRAEMARQRMAEIPAPNPGGDLW